MTLSPVTEDCLKQAVREFIQATGLGSGDESSRADMGNSYYPVTLLEIFRAGVETLNCKTISERAKESEEVSNCGL